MVGGVITASLAIYEDSPNLFYIGLGATSIGALGEYFRLRFDSLEKKISNIKP